MNPASVHSARSRSLPSSPASSKGQPKQKDVEDSDSEYKSSSEEDDDDVGQEEWEDIELSAGSGDKTFLEVMIGESFEDMHHVRCKVLKECASVSSTEWKSILSSDTEYSHLDMSFCAVFVLPENWKWTDVIQCFPPDILDRTLQGIILINFQNSLTLSDDFFANVDLPDMFVCVVSRSNLSKILPLRTKSVLETQARVVRSTCIDFHSSKTASSQDSCDQMKFDVTLTKFFNQAEEKGLDIGLYGHIISYVDCVSKHHKHVKDGLKFVAGNLRKERFDLSHFLLHCLLIYKMQRKKTFKRHLNLIEGCLKMLLVALLEELESNQEEIVKIVQEHLQYDNVVAHEGAPLFFQLLADVCREMATIVKSVDEQWLGLEIMFIVLHIAFMLRNGCTSDNLIRVWNLYFMEQHVCDCEKLTVANVAQMTSAIQLGQLLELPAELCFGGCHLGQFIIDVCNVLTLGTLQKAIQQFESLLKISGLFLTDFLVTSYQLLSKKSKLTPARRKQKEYLPSESVVNEGSGLMITVITLLLESDQYDDRCMRPLLGWWEEVLQSMVIADVPCALEVIQTIDGHFQGSSKMKVEIKDNFYLKTKEVLSHNLVHMDLKILTQYVKTIKDYRFSKELVVQYLRSLHSGTNEERSLLSKPYFKEFLKAYYSRWHAHSVKDEKCIIEYIFEASKTYENSQEFIEDLLNLGRWPLVNTNSSVEVCALFSCKLKNFISASKLRTTVCEILHKVIKGENPSFNALEQLVYEEFVEIVCSNIPNSKHLLHTMPPPDMQCVNTACSQLYGYYKDSPHLWGEPPPIPISWYWKIIIQLCDELKPKFDTFLNYQTPLLVVATVHGVYLTSVRGKGHMEISPSVTQYKYMEWVSEVQSSLSDWKQRVTEKKCSITDLKHCLALSQTWGKDLKWYLDVEDVILDKDFIDSRILEVEEVSKDICSLLLMNKKYSTLGVLENFKVLVPPSLQGALIKVVANCGCVVSELEEKPQLKKDAHLHMLKDLLHNLKEFVDPMTPFQHFLVHFLPRNHFFKVFYDKAHANYLADHDYDICNSTGDDNGGSDTNIHILLGQPRQNCSLSMKAFCEILSATQSSLMCLLIGNISYEDLTQLSSGWDEDTLKSQFEALSTYHFEGVSDDQVVDMGGIKHIICFQQFRDFLELFEEVCRLYNLSRCLHAAEMGEIFMYLAIMQSKEHMMRLTSKEAIAYSAKIRSCLHLQNESTGRECVQLFEVVRQSENFVKFLRDKRMFGESGSRQFEQNVQLITANLQYEEFQEDVLNNLRIAYEFISPFLDPDIERTQFMKQIHHVCGLDHKVLIAPFNQLKIVNENIDLIYLWFTKAEGNPLEELEHIVEHGYFEVAWEDVTSAHLPSDSSRPCGQMQVLLNFPPTKKASMEEDAVHNMVVWTKEDIDDFIRQLGLLEKGKERDVQAFQKIFETAKKMLNTQQQLRKLGHQEMETLSLSCKCSLDEAAYKVQSLRSTLTSWEERLSSLDDQCQKLLLFSTQKFLRMYHIMQGITSTREMVDFLMKEMAISSSSYQDLTSIIDDAFQQSLSCSSHEERLLGTLTKVVHNFLPMQESPIPKDDHRNTRVILHLITCDTPQHLFDIALSILGPHPEAYQIFRCRPSTTIKEISRFFKRVETFWSLPFVIFAVTLLPPKVQEHLVHLHTKFLLRISVPFQLHYVASGSTILQDLPRVTVDNQTVHRGPELDQTRKLFLDTYAPVSKVTCLKLVHGKEGDGKSHFIQKMMTSDDHAQSVVITVNEAFSPLAAITELNKLDLKAKNAIHCNFTFLPAMEPCSTSQRLHLPKQFGPYSNHDSIAVEVDWFFFDLFYLHSVEDYESGQSFELPHKLNWTFYIEVPSCSSSKSSLEEFLDRYPLLKLIGCPEHVSSDIPYNVDASVQLVCKYLRAYELRDHPTRKKKEGIDKLLPKKDNKRSITFANLPDFTKESEKECHRLLQKYMKSHVRVNKLQQKLFIGYMKRRCVFMENFPHFNYNSDYPKLGSTIMGTMLDEVNKFCLTDRQREWSQSNLLQIVYEYTSKWDGGFLLLTVNHEALKEKLVDYRKIGIHIPHPSEIHTREFLDRYLAAALNVPLDPDTKRIKLIDDKGYVLTLDYFLKMLEIHERMESGIPVIIEGETGVGKTALLEMLSLLWNASLMDEHRKFLERFSDELRVITEKYSRSIPEEHTDSFLALMEATTVKQMVPIEVIMQVCCCTLSCEDGEIINVTSKLSSCMKKSTMDFSIALLEYESSWQEMQNSFKDQLPQELSFIQFWKQCIRSHETLRSESVAALLFCFLRAEPMQIFHKFSIHSALTPMDIGKFLKPILDQSNRLKYAWDMVAHEKVKANIPKVTVFFDEINTSSCPGLLKEILVDRTFQGDSVPENVFIVAACNPHRGNSIILEERKAISKVRTRTTYYVHPLHPTLLHLKWDYGALNEDQELLYVQQKMEMISKEIGCDDHGDLSYFAELIVCSQNLMRKYACEHMANFLALCPSDAKKFSYSCVSQRDIQRVFIFLNWLMNCYQSESFKDRFGRNVTLAEKFETAVSLSLALVYYVRLDDNPNTNGNGPLSYRSQYVIDLQERTGQSLYINTALKQELMFYGKRLCIPPGVAKTRVLLENMFCIIACCCTRTPLIITGPPGSSKTLSFSLTLDNIKGRQSTLDPFKNFELFPSLDPHYYQCSVQTTSTEVETVFQRAINRQRRFNVAGLPINCVVFMDEAGIPEESRESLKVLHKVLDNPEVSFVAITNHLLDASKTNRALSLFRSQYVQEDLNELMKECLPNIPEAANHLCEAYFKLMKDDYFQEFFGLRDFIHLGHYLKRNAAMNMLDPQCLMEAIERNFNGYQDYENVCQQFLQANNYFPEDVTRRSVVSVLKSSLEVESAKIDLTNEAQKVRYKLVIDSSEDESVTRLLYAFNIVDPATTRTYMCSSFPEDGAVQEINTIAAIRHAIRKGFTIVMTQTGSIHGSFYDVFNQYFKVIEDLEKGTRFYANIAIGSNLKQCQVHRDFQCIVVIKRSELRTTPGPFLNRFEKYSLSHKDFLDARMSEIPQNLRNVLIAVKSKVQEFTNLFETANFYGAVEGETVNSLVLSVLPRCGFVPNLDEDVTSPDMGSGQFQAIEYILNVLRMNAGLRFTLASFSKETAWTINPGDGTGQAFLSGSYSRLEIITHVDNAMKYLLSKDPNSIHITAEEQFVISVIGQWLVFYLCKKLINLMTAESFIFGHVKMPAWCVDCYLMDQNHFSLKMVIDSYFQRLCKGDQHPLEYLSNKVICFTRSSPELHGLPAFNSATCEIGDPVFADVKKIVYDNLERVHLCKMSSIMSEKVFQDQLELFFDNSNSDIMVLVTDMQETSSSIVNHARVMVEEMENSNHQKKLFIFLLHFPSSLYHKHCYPAIFAPGWDHCYLDTVQPRELNMRQWFVAAYQGETDNSQLFYKEMLNNLKEDAVRVVSSRITIGSTNGGCFNGVCESGEKFKRVDKLLFGPVGTKLVDLYMQCWKKADLVFCLKEAAEHTWTTMSPLSITEVVQDHFRSTFFNFLSFVIHNINTDLNIDLVFGIDPESETMKLFLSILSVWPLPKLAEIKAYNNTFDSRQMEAVKPSFPFFWKVCSALDQLVGESIEEYQKERPLNWVSRASHTFNAQNEEIVKRLAMKIAENSNEILGLALSAVQKHPQLWEDYKKHFLSSKCHIKDIKHPNVIEVLESHFGRVLAIPDVTRCLATMHFKAHAEPLDLGPFTHMPIDHIISGGNNREEEGVVMSLFDVFSRDPISDDQAKITDRIEVLKSWHAMMLEKMSNPVFKQWIYTRATKSACQSKMHIMAAIFFLMQSWDLGSCNDANYKFVLTVRKPLLQQMFTEGNCIGFKEVMENILRVMQQFTTEGTTNQPLTVNMSHFLQAIMPYFINAWRPWDNFTLRNIKWFLEEINKFADNGTLRTLSHFSNEVEKDSLLWNLQVHILGDLLTCQLKSGHNWSNPLGVFSIYARQKVGAMLCARASSPFSYFPVVYRERFQSYRGQNLGDAIVQPLADAYFLCLMEHWGSLQEHNLSMLLRLISQIQKVHAASKDDSESVVLQIELQAVSQAALNAFASDVVSSHLGHKLSTPDVKTVQRVISNSVPECHKKMMMIYLLRHLKSEFALNHFLGSQTAEAISDVLEVQVRLRPGQFPKACSRLDCFSFMLNDAADTDLSNQYQLVSKYMCATECDKSLKKLESKLQQILRKEDLFCGSNGLEMDRKLFFKMSVWLVVYYEFFSKQKTSPQLADAIRRYLSILDFTPEQMSILNCFLTRSFIKAEENIYECDSTIPNGRVDPLYSLFMDTDMMVKTGDTALCNVIANMVGVGFSLPCKVTHLWTFLFEPAALTGTYFPGFLGNKPASDQPWSSGLDEAGDFCESELGSTLGLSQHSLRFMLLLNFGALSFSMLTLTEAQSAIHGSVISESVDIRHFCHSNLQRLWNQLALCVNKDTSRRNFLATQYLQQLLYVVHTEKYHLDSVFSESSQVLQYEQFWHRKVHEEVKLKCDDYCLQVRNDYFTTLRNLESQCDEFPTLNKMKHDLIEHIGIECNGPQVLLKFVNIYRQLSVGSTLLPELVKFYTWLNTHLLHLLTYQSARDSTVEQVLLLASKRYSEGDSRVDNYHKMRVQFNKFVDLCDGCLWHDDQRIEKLDGSTKIERLLTAADGNDWLCHTIDFIVDLHNSLLELTKISANDSLKRWLPMTEVPCSVTLFGQNMAIVWEGKELEQKLTRLFHSKSSFHGPGPLRTKSAYHWDELECAVVREYIIGKPKLLDTNKGLKKPFRFRTVPMEDVTCGIYGVTSPGHPMDLAAVRQELPDEYTKPCSLNNEDKKALECTFHKLDYHSLVDLVLSLRNAAAKLKEEFLRDSIDQHDELKVLFTSENEHTQTIGTVRLQESVLMKFKVTQLYQILVMFVEWIDSCYYAFSDVSYTLKTHLPTKVQEDFRDGLRALTSTQPEQLNLVTDLENILSNFIVKGTKYLMQGSNLASRLEEVVEMYNLCEQKVVRIIPHDTQLQHIVHFILFLRREKNTLERNALIAVSTQVDTWQDRLDLPLSDSQSFSASIVFSRDQPPTVRTRYASSSEVTIWTDHKIGPILDQSTPDTLIEWTVEQVSAWLESMNLREYIQYFQENGVDGEKLLQCDHEYLEQIGVVSKPDRIKILTRRKGVTSTHVMPSTVSTCVSEWTVEEVMSWLENIDLEEYAEKIEGGDINGEELLQYDHECLEEIGVMSKPDRIKIITKLKAKDCGKDTQPNSPGHVSGWTVDEVVEWLKGIKMGEYVKVFHQKKVDGAELLQYDLKCLGVIGVRKKQHQVKIISELKKLQI